ncbi:hypothetical protein BJ875DRAFT_472699 [Amylocarpus encephaloides]|uniref:Uncharacterized protein n=1 Tax=Amylocarpus encephaloides TaxID=45428 RepID=A0A9P7YAU8_9HELO|nr:hypothetical protein BJ875DRAFT_472699 [Amylocarpus encephaloides]
MRLLQYNNDGDFSLTEFFEDDIPKKYTILSHRWGAEVTFKNLARVEVLKVVPTVLRAFEVSFVPRRFVGHVEGAKLNARE